MSIYSYTFFQVCLAGLVRMQKVLMTVMPKVNSKPAVRFKRYVGWKSETMAAQSKFSSFVNNGTHAEIH